MAAMLSPDIPEPATVMAWRDADGSLRLPRDLAAELRDALDALPPSPDAGGAANATSSSSALAEIADDPITLGPLVLRCETAATYALSVLSYELQNSG